jgi:hypothetical protein
MLMKVIPEWWGWLGEDQTRHLEGSRDAPIKVVFLLLSVFLSQVFPFVLDYIGRRMTVGKRKEAWRFPDLWSSMPLSMSLLRGFVLAACRVNALLGAP